MARGAGCAPACWLPLPPRPGSAAALRMPRRQAQLRLTPCHLAASNARHAGEEFKQVSLSFQARAHDVAIK